MWGQCHSVNQLVGRSVVKILRMCNEQVIVLWGKYHSVAGRKLSNVVNSHSLLYVLSSFNYKNSHFLEFESERNRLENTQPMYVVFLRSYFGENCIHSEFGAD